MYDMDENFNFYEAVMAQNGSPDVAKPAESSVEALLMRIDDQALAEQIRHALKDKQ